MPEFELREIHIFYACAAAAAIMLVEALYLIFAEAKDHRDLVNRRVKIMAESGDQQAILIQLRKERGMTGEGWRSLFSLGTLLTQSGLTMGVTRFWLLIGVAAFIIFLGALVFVGNLLVALAVAAPFALFAPFLVLSILRAKRRKVFGNQLPDAIDLIVRGLKAGYPVPVAFSVVARELPDPIGTEFGIVSDEVTFGAGFVEALYKMNERVGQRDLPLFMSAIAIQTTVGGNLREILEGLAEVIRQRIKLRRKVKSISAEGRMSAIILSSMPLFVVVAVNLMSPDYYAGVLGEPAFLYGVAGILFWYGAGMAMIFKMVNFKI